jgi:methionyl aminopeptidase
MIRLKSSREAELMRAAGKVAAEARRLAGKMARVGVTTKEIDAAVFEFIKSRGATPTFLNYHGFPASICASVNEQVIHGIPDSRALRDGDIISIDVGATKDGYIGDCAATYAVGRCGAEALRLIDVTKRSFFEGIRYAREGCRISDISHAVQDFVESNGFSVVREYVGHGVGSMMHEPPEVPNFGGPGHGVRVVRGMTLAIEPMVNAGGHSVRVLGDKWTVVTQDGSLSAHYENTILVTDGEPEILTAAGDI